MDSSSKTRSERIISMCLDIKGVPTHKVLVQCEGLSQEDTSWENLLESA